MKISIITVCLSIVSDIVLSPKKTEEEFALPPLVFLKQCDKVFYEVELVAALSSILPAVALGLGNIEPARLGFLAVCGLYGDEQARYFYILGGGIRLIATLKVYFVGGTHSCTIVVPTEAEVAILVAVRNRASRFRAPLNDVAPSGRGVGGYIWYGHCGIDRVCVYASEADSTSRTSRFDEAMCRVGVGNLKGVATLKHGQQIKYVGIPNGTSVEVHLAATLSFL